MGTIHRPLTMNSLIIAAVFACVALTQASPAPHIIRGRDARVGEFPHQGSLQRLGRRGPIDTYPGHTCGCVLISATWVVTAGHCVGAGANGLYVVMGLHKRGNSNEGAPMGYYIERIYTHPGWTGRIGTTDAALIQLEEEVEMNQYVRPIASIASSSDDFTGQTCTISGWGVTREGFGSLAVTLQAADVPVMSNSQCRQSFSIVNEGHICIGGEGDGGSCNGDSGGPLVCGNKLAGVTSFGIRGCYTVYPSVYTRMGYVREWIRQTAGV